MDGGEEESKGLNMMSDETIERAIDAMLKGDTDTLFDGGDMEQIAVIMALTFASSPRKRGWRKFSSRLPRNNAEKDKVLDIIMANAYAGESLKVSISRLAKATWFMGFEVLTPFAAMCAYRTFGKELTNEYARAKRAREASARRGGK